MKFYATILFIVPLPDWIILMLNQSLYYQSNEIHTNLCVVGELTFIGNTKI